MKFLKKITVFLLLWTMVCGLWTISYAAIPHLINYQGRLTDSAGAPITGSRDITFRIYEQESGGSAIWTETHAATLDKGIFNVMLGGVTALNIPFDKSYWLSIQVGSETEMVPRQRLASVGYAYRAENADQAQNASKVNNIEASTTPTANKLLPLDSNAKMPSSALGLKVYDSGWFAVNTSEPRTRAITHNLGTTKVLATIWFSTAADGSSDVSNVTFVKEWANGNKSRGACIRDMTNTTCNIVWGYTDIQCIPNSGSDDIGYYSGYYKVIMFALE